jgi:hypothetical protein
MNAQARAIKTFPLAFAAAESRVHPKLGSVDVRSSLCLILGPRQSPERSRDPA